MEFNKVIFSDTSARKYKKSLNKKESISRVKNDSKNEIKLPETASIVNFVHPAMKNLKYYDLLNFNTQLNNYEMNELFNKLKIEEFNCFFYTICSILSSMIYHELLRSKEEFITYQNNPNLYDLSIFTLLMVVSLSCLLFIISSIFRYSIMISLDITNLETSPDATILNKKYFWLLIIEIILAILHPNIWTKDLKFYTNKEWYLVEVNYYINEYLILVQLIRFYVIFRYLIIQTPFYSARTSRIAKMFGDVLERMYAVKCLLSVNPYKFLIVCTTLFIIIFSYMIKIIEGPVYLVRKESQDIKNDLRYVENSAWYVLATMTTIGYGDYFAVTNFGRLITIIVTMFGSVLISLIVMTLQNSLNLSDSENRAFEDKEKYDFKKKFEDAAATYCRVSFNYSYNLKKYLKAWEDNSKNLPLLKRKLENSILNRIITKRKFKSIKQQYRNRFDIFDNNEILKEKIESLLTLSGNETTKFHTIYEDSLALKDLVNKVEYSLYMNNQEKEKIEVSSIMSYT